jgi:phosphopantothenoylcysteine decarboxylase/phosphopantothenate--cysteine ligase
LAIKRVLITAGPTWAAIDKVRVISNISTGRTGLILAEALVKKGLKPVLLLGPAEVCCLNPKIKLLRYRFFEELRNSLKRLGPKNFDIIIHAAAVSDYLCLKPLNFKKPSGKNWSIKLKAAEKLIASFKRESSGSFVVGFKFEPDAQAKSLIKEAKKLLSSAKIDLVVANTMTDKRYTAYIVAGNSASGPYKSREEMIKALIPRLPITNYQLPVTNS